MKQIIKAAIEEIGTVKRGLRRKYYMYLRPAYVKSQMQKRKGTCGMHGCCDLSRLHKYRPCLCKTDRTKCLKWDKLPKECQIYPLDEKDKIPATRSYCNFYWED